MSSIRFNLLRYLIALRVSAPLVRLLDHPAVEFSLALGTAIADGLPTSEARPWRKALANWDPCFNSRSIRGTPLLGVKGFQGPPDVSWPIDAVLFFYPHKRHYGRGEPIFWELKLLGDAADHAFFLEVILPALESLGRQGLPDRQYTHCLWGHFDVDSVYVASGDRWDPLAREGRLDLGYRPAPDQWARGWADRLETQPNRRSLAWLTPVELQPGRSLYEPPADAPLPGHILEAFTHRLSALLFGRHYDIDAFWSMLNDRDALAFMAASREATEICVARDDVARVSNPWPGRWTGLQVFDRPVSAGLLGWLALASLIHIGRYTHYGCGTFLMD